MKKVWQFLTSIAPGDAVSNDCLAISELLFDKNVGNHIGARFNHIKSSSRAAKSIQTFEKAKKLLSPDDLVIYHLSVADEMNDWFTDLPNPKVVIYHNMTPTRYFRKYDPQHSAASDNGRQEASRMAGHVDLAIADSRYNADELVEMGFSAPVVIPVLIPFEDYQTAPDPKTVEKMSDGKTNILFVGRIAPNKCQEDIIAVFSEYVKHYNQNARLILAGSSTGMELYDSQLKKYAEALGLSDQVIFTGHVSFPEILAYYRTAHAFVIMSEHEGFCVPVVESYLFEIPVMACDYGAIGETMGNAGVLLSRKDPGKAAAVLDQIVKDEEFRKIQKERMKEELKRFDPEYVRARLWETISPLLEKEETT
ncbi:MAG: glycosyltransferase family 4 protein [Clostridiales bacterium]|nr:glycosyltransferase family 4 protein [Clostridiales bacterium]